MPVAVRSQPSALTMPRLRVSNFAYPLTAPSERPFTR
jgi:hypothetical protein